MAEKMTPYEIALRTNLLKKFRDGPFSPVDAEQLKNILEKEKEEVWETGDMILLFAIILLLSLVIAYLGNKDMDLKSLSRTIDDFVYGKKKKK